METKNKIIEENVEETKNKPIMSVRISDVLVNVWSNKKVIDGKEENLKSFQLQKIYKVGEEWKSTQSFNFNDIDKAIYVLNELKKKVSPVKIEENKE